MNETFRGRSSLELLQDQLDGLTAWQVAARARELAESARRESREARLEASRRLDALRRANAAVLARADASITSSMDLLGKPRAVVAHRQDWMREKISKGLGDLGVLVVAELDDGADTLGTAVAEQPDLLVIEDRLPSMLTTEVIRSLGLFAPRTVVAAQVESDREVGVMLDAGASAVFSRRVPPGVLCDQLSAYLRERPDRALLLT